MTIKRYICTDCAIGEESPCAFIASNPDNQIPVSCPYGKCGEDAEWKEVQDEN